VHVTRAGAGRRRPGFRAVCERFAENGVRFC
jgi:hypothetical protein